MKTYPARLISWASDKYNLPFACPKSVFKGWGKGVGENAKCPTFSACRCNNLLVTHLLNMPRTSP
jgi:hypothetical protein